MNSLNNIFGFVRGHSPGEVSLLAVLRKVSKAIGVALLCIEVVRIELGCINNITRWP